jgi:hypothetical protein
MTTLFLTANTQMCKKKGGGTSYLRKNGITFSLTEIQSSPFAYFKANKNTFSLTYYAKYNQQFCFQSLQV